MSVAAKAPPPLRGTAAELRSRHSTDTVFRRPNLRGAVAKALATQERLPQADWSATAATTPAQPEPPLLEPSSPAQGVPLSDLMREIARQYDLNVEEHERFEWLITTGMLPTVGDVFGACEHLQFPRRSQAPSPADGGHDADQTSSFGAHGQGAPQFPISWETEDVCPAVQESFQSPLRSRTQHFRLDASNVAREAAPCGGTPASRTFS